MACELLIFRHGKSDWGSDALNDFDRPLARRGRKAVKRMASWLRDQSLLPEHILSSTAERARQTALRLCRYADIPETRVEWRDAIYAADLETLLDVLDGFAAAACQRAMEVVDGVAAPVRLSVTEDQQLSGPAHFESGSGPTTIVL